MRIALAAAVLATPLLGYEVLSLASLRQERERELEAEAARLLALVDAEQRRSVEDIRHIFATLEATGVPRLPQSGCSGILGALRRSYPAHLEIQLADRTGHVWCATETGSVGIEIGDLPSFHEAMRSDRLVIGEAGPIRAERNEPARAILPYRQRYRGADGQPGGTMSALIDLEWLETYVNSVSWPRYAVVTMVHPEGKILARAPTDVGLVIGADLPDRLRFTLTADRPGRGRSHGLDGVVRSYAFMPPKATASGLMLAVAVDTVEALLPIDESAAGSLAFFMLLLGLVFAGGAYGTSRLATARRQEAAAAARMASVLESTSDAVAEIETDWRVSYLNPQARELLGVERDPAGLRAQDAFEWLAGSELEKRLGDAMKRRGADEFEFLGPKTGRWFALRVFPSHKGLAIYFRDITERRLAEGERRGLAEKLERERALLHTVINHIPAGLIVVDAASHHLVLRNAAADRILGHPVDGDPFTCGFQPGRTLQPDGTPYAAGEVPLLRATSDGVPVEQVELLYQCDDGRRATLAVSATPVLDGRGLISLCVCIFVDLSDRKRIETELRRSEERLHAALQAASAATFDTDLRTGAVIWSREQKDLYGVTSDDPEPCGLERWAAALHPADRTRMLSLVERARAGAIGGVNDRFCILHPAKGVRWIMMTARVFRDGRGVPVRLSGLNMDITEREETARALARERFLLQAIMDSLPIGLLVIEAPSGRLLMHNPATEQLIGHAAEAVSGVAEYSTYGGLRADGTPMAAEEYPPARALRGEVVSQEELHYRRGDGSVTVFLVEAVPVRGADGRIELVVVAFHDISRRKAMEEALRDSEQKLSAALASASAGTWTWDIRSETLHWSAGNYLIHGLEPGDGIVRYEDWLGAVHPADRDKARLVVEETLAERRTGYDLEYRVVLPDGAIRWVAGRGRADYDEAGGPVRMSGLSVDVTDRKTLEIALRAAKEESDRANRAKARFLAAASHDLRQPLQSMALFGGALHMHVKDERGKDMLLMLERGTETMKSLLDSLLDVSRLDVEVVKPQLSGFNLDKLIREIIESYRPLAASKGLAVSADTSCKGVRVHSDRTMLGRIVRNLVENAVRYTERGWIAVSCRMEGGLARIDVADTGIGIPDDQMSMIFDEFHQVANLERDRNRGLGLGLSIVQRLSRILGHEVRVRSRLGEGSVFTVEVPVDADDDDVGTDNGNALPDDVRASRRVGRGRTALLIDDDTIVLMSLRTLFEEWGYDTLIAGSSEQAVATVAETGHRPDVIVADYRLRAGRTGCEAIVDVRKQLGAEIPGVILTGETGAECARDISRHGLGMIHKPVMPGQLSSVLDRLLGPPRGEGSP